MERKMHFKLYKAGKTWLLAGISVFTVGVATVYTSTSVQAATDEISVKVAATASSVGTDANTNPTSSAATSSVADTAILDQKTDENVATDQVATAATVVVPQTRSAVTASTKAATSAVPNLNDVSAVGNQDAAHQGTASTAGQDYTINGDGESTSTTGEYQLTTDTKNQSAHLVLNSQIDFNQDFTISGEIKLGDNISGADGLTFVFSPSDPASLATAETGGGLGLEGLPNSFGLAIDEHYNKDNGDFDNLAAMSDPLGVGTAEGVISWRTTDENGNLNSNKANPGFLTLQNTSSDDPTSQVVSINRSTVDGNYHPFTISYDAATSTLIITLADNDNQNQVYKKTGANSATIWTRTITDAQKAENMSLSIAASTGDDTNAFAVKLGDYSYTKGVSNITFQETDGTNVLPGTTTKTVTANVGDTVQVFRNQALAQAAIDAGTVSADLAVVAPEVDGYVLAATSQSYAVKEDNSNPVSLVYVEKVDFTVTPVDDAGNTIGTPTDESGVADDSLDSSSLPSVPGYHVDPSQTNTVPTDEGGNVEVVYVPDTDTPYTIQPVTDDGDSLGDSTSYKGTTGEAAQLPSVPGYHATTTEEIPAPNTDGSGKTVEVVYAPNTDTPYVVQPVDEAGNDLGNPVSETGITDTNTVVPDIPGYHATESETIPAPNEDGTPNTVEITYAPDTDTPVLVQPVDENGDEIGDPVTITGTTGTDVVTPSVPGYTTTTQEVTVPTPNTDGSGKTVNVVYAPSTDTSVEVQPVDKNGDSIGDPITVTGTTGETSTAPEIPGYNATTTVTIIAPSADGSAKTVTVVYTPSTNTAVTVQPVDENGNSIGNPIDTTGTTGQPVTAPEIDGYYVVKTPNVPATGGNVQVTYAKNKTADSNSVKQVVVDTSGKLAELSLLSNTNDGNQKSVSSTTTSTGELPQTNEQSSIWSLVGMALLTMFGFGFVVKRRINR